ncbi:class I SAM-dependent methyltransferase [Leptothoe spongobia]|uniref:Methyltransferase domain-containing protein n=1 Tax=Leptothoe spongobia TAU-MAC 1115 TaxID=1967444 RepID=A0A947GI46_9CYAN|nr:class I SAM-dependent methyltransferase [Leptothoe spongobia]MBT9315429.1 methyltransferase domain-containing protein [Leptothoe spongobia TAU-MAC 1115]
MTIENRQIQQPWDTDRYQNQHSFVWHYGTALMDLLNPQPGEQILDLGCGTGQLTQALAETGAAVHGLDADVAMVATAQEKYPHLSFAVADARNFQVTQSVDSIFSNAVLHWVKPPEQAVQAIANALKPGGKFVAEFGGKGNVQKIVQAVETIRQRTNLSPWYFPSISEYTHLLESHGLEVTFAALIERPTPLNDGEQGLSNWLKMFGSSLFTGLSTDDTNAILHGVEDLLRPQLYDGNQWHADYRRLRLIAVKKS